MTAAAHCPISLCGDGSHWIIWPAGIVVGLILAALAFIGDQ